MTGQETPSFNEAAAYRRGIHKDSFTRIIHATLASMRPRHIAAEYGEIEVFNQAALLLQ